MALGKEVALLRIFKRSKETDEKTEQALERTRKGWFSNISGLFDRGKIDDEIVGGAGGAADRRRHWRFDDAEDPRRPAAPVEKDRIKEPEVVRDLLKQELVEHPADRRARRAASGARTARRRRAGPTSSSSSA